jgi:glutamyl/glutaminyl-tRNA synthetase
MGYTPHKINFTSDYFEQMLHYANSLVKGGKAYVCESTQNEI